MVLVSGTLVYGKGDSKEAEEQQLGGLGAEIADMEPGQPPILPAAAAAPRAAQPTGVPRPGDAAASTPIMMRGTPRSFKVGACHNFQIALTFLCAEVDYLAKVILSAVHSFIPRQLSCFLSLAFNR